MWAGPALTLAFFSFSVPECSPEMLRLSSHEARSIAQIRLKGTMKVLGAAWLLFGAVVSLSAVRAEQEEGEFIRDMKPAVYGDYRPFSDTVFSFLLVVHGPLS
jgi:hypothetical protein